jgi:hypothetical protein
MSQNDHWKVKKSAAPVRKMGLCEGQEIFTSVIMRTHARLCGMLTATIVGCVKIFPILRWRVDTRPVKTSAKGEGDYDHGDGIFIYLSLLAEGLSIQTRHLVVGVNQMSRPDGNTSSFALDTKPVSTSASSHTAVMPDSATVDFHMVNLVAMPFKPMNFFRIELRGLIVCWSC